MSRTAVSLGAIMMLQAACAPLARPRTRPPNAPEICVKLGAKAPNFVDLTPLSAHEIDPQLVASLPRVAVTGEDDDPQLLRTADGHVVAKYWATTSARSRCRDAMDVTSVGDREPSEEACARIAYVWDADAKAWTFVGVGTFRWFVPGAGLFLGVTGNGTADGAGYHELVAHGPGAPRLRRIAALDAGNVVGMSGEVPLLWRRSGDTVSIRCLGSAGAVAVLELELPERFQPADKDAVRDQRLLLVERGPPRPIVTLGDKRPPFRERVWILDLADRDRRFIGYAPGRYVELATSIPRWTGFAGAAWARPSYNPQFDFRVDRDNHGRSPTAYVDIVSEDVR